MQVHTHGHAVCAASPTCHAAHDGDGVLRMLGHESVLGPLTTGTCCACMQTLGLRPAHCWPHLRFVCVLCVLGSTPPTYRLLGDECWECPPPGACMRSRQAGPASSEQDADNAQHAARRSARVQGKSGRRRNMPKQFALKELSSPKVFYPGVSGDIRDYLPLNEPSIQRFLKHATIVETYWADVRCLDPKTDAPLEITAYDLTVDADDPKEDDGPGADQAGQSWTPLDRLRDVELSCSHVAETRRIAGGAQEPPQGIKLQMRIAMEHCDLGALRVLCVLCCACRGPRGAGPSRASASGGGAGGEEAGAGARGLSWRLHACSVHVVCGAHPCICVAAARAGGAHLPPAAHHGECMRAGAQRAERAQVRSKTTSRGRGSRRGPWRTPCPRAAAPARSTCCDACCSPHSTSPRR